MGFSFVQANGAGASESSTTIDVSLTGVTAGNLICIFVKHEGASTTINVSDGTSSFAAGSSYVSHGGGDLHVQCFYLLASAASGSVTYTATFGAGRAWRRVVVMEFAYTATATFTDGNGSAGDGTAPTTGDITAANNSVVFAGYGEYGGTTISTFDWNSLAAGGSMDYTGDTDGVYGGACAWYRIVGASDEGTGPATAALAISDTYACAGMAIEDAAGGGGLPIPVAMHHYRQQHQV